ncbi:hypothetical protein Ddye_030650 [Dipteronia dyeriana]|uniref:Uncharacterized protein n=1 Tax=Dipteronia dyeriana TaxID=168575 RepID=A0AAD9THS0_9ROSI|nr:hypothetical protein Ddye_030650 [Dipteronia dyeriana]
MEGAAILVLAGPSKSFGLNCKIIYVTAIDTENWDNGPVLIRFCFLSLNILVSREYVVQCLNGVLVSEEIKCKNVKLDSVYKLRLK